MTLKETTLPFLAQDCRQAFGPTEGDTLYQQTEARFQALLAQADDRGSPAIRDHLARKLLPPLAFYQTLRPGGWTRPPPWTWSARRPARPPRKRRQKWPPWPGSPLPTPGTA